jgi:CHAD domain-containing protein/uncharacterized protein YjbK
MEIEAKFTILDRDTFIQLGNLDSINGFTLTEGHILEIQDTYLDTKKHKLYTKGFALRLRESAEDAWLTIKSLTTPDMDLVHRREEIEVRIPTGLSPEEWPPGAVREKLQSLIGGASLDPIVSLQQTRLIRQLMDGLREVAEISVDEVRITGDGNEETFIELEIELRAGGTNEELTQIAQVLQSDWKLTPQNQSKFSRALELTSLSKPDPKNTRPSHPQVRKKPKKKPGITRNDSMTSAARKTLSLHFKQMLYHEPGTRAGDDIEELHDMRVATRRLRAALPIFEKFIDQDRFSPIAKGLKRTGRALGAVRDLDVFWEKTEEYLEALPFGQPADLTALQTVWAEERIQARKQMLKYFDSKKYRNFLIEFQAFLDDSSAWVPPALPANGEPIAHRLPLVVPVAVYQRLGEVLAYDEWITETEIRLDQFHNLRIAAKRLRYTLEYFQEVLGPEVHMLIERIKTLQDHLGNLQDCVIAREILTDFLHWGAWRPDKRKQISTPYQPMLFRDLAVSTYLRAREQEQQILIDSFPHVWGEITNPYFSHSIAAMLTAW